MIQFISIEAFYLILFSFLVFLFIRPQLRWIFLLVLSLLTYYLLSPMGCLLAVLQSLFAYGMGWILQRQDRQRLRQKLLLWVFIIIQFLPLIFFKYLKQTSFYFSGAESIILPLGLSFYTFQIISYLVDIYWQQRKSEKNLGRLLLYILFFGNKIAGPIESPKLLQQFSIINLPNPSELYGFLVLILIGLFKKFSLADQIASFVDPIYLHPSDNNGLPVFIGILLTKYQIYCDFSGYSDIALGVSGLFGIHVTQNFDRPFATLKLSDFWRRWHISLQNWIRHYVFYPVASSGLGRFGTYPILIVTFLLFAIWHEARWTFVAYGLLQATLVYLFHRIKTNIFSYQQWWKPFRWLLFYVFLIALPGVLFRAETWQQVCDIFTNLSFDCTHLEKYFFPNDGRSLLAVLATIICFEIFFWQTQKVAFFSRIKSMHWLLKYAFAVIFIFVLILTAKSSNGRQFIYSRF